MAERCVVWEEQGKINFNFFDSKENKTKNVSDFEEEIAKITGKVVINGGHYIPDLKQGKLGKNPIKTWEFACSLAKDFSDRGTDASTSLILNDLPFTPNERKKINKRVPNKFLDIAKKYNINIIGVYTEKKLANKFASQKQSTKWNIYGEEITNLCVQAIISYLRDIKKQGAKVSIWITPKCSHKNLIDAIKIFNKKEGGIRNICYFYTNNCFL